VTFACFTFEVAEGVALRLGLVTEIMDQDRLGETSRALAVELARGPTVAYGEVRNLLLDSWDNSLETQLEREARSLARATRTADGWHGIESAVASRQSQFEGR
jgi:2-(1,2-epoxy-1,2-dihydrophenyl)acetyl-CoA isomerase